MRVNRHDVSIASFLPRYCRIAELLHKTHRVQYMHAWLWESWVLRDELYATAPPT